MADSTADVDADSSSTPAGDPPPRRRTALIAACATAVVAIALIALLATAEDSGERRANSDLVGQVAPPVAGETLDGSDYDMDRARNSRRWVLVNFFQTSCIPCRREHPELVEFAGRHAEADDAAVVSVTFDDTTANVQSFFAEEGGDWPVLIGDTASIALDYGVVAVPESYLIAPNGQVVLKVLGGVTADGLDRAIAELTA